MIIVPTGKFHKVTSVSRAKGGRVESVQVTMLYPEYVDRHGRIEIMRSTTFHLNLESDGLFHWRKRVKEGDNWKVLHQTFRPDQIPNFSATQIGATLPKAA